MALRRWGNFPLEGDTTGVPIVFTTPSPLPAATQGVPYSVQINTSGGLPPVTQALLFQTPGDLWFLSPTGLLTGTPKVLDCLVTSSGDFYVTASGDFYQG